MKIKSLLIFVVLNGIAFAAGIETAPIISFESERGKIERLSVNLPPLPKEFVDGKWEKIGTKIVGMLQAHIDHDSDQADFVLRVKEGVNAGRTLYEIDKIFFRPDDKPEDISTWLSTSTNSCIFNLISSKTFYDNLLAFQQQSDGLVNLFQSTLESFDYYLKSRIKKIKSNQPLPLTFPDIHYSHNLDLQSRMLSIRRFHLLLAIMADVFQAGLSEEKLPKETQNILESYKNTNLKKVISGKMEHFEDPDSYAELMDGEITAIHYIRKKRWRKTTIDGISVVNITASEEIEIPANSRQGRRASERAFMKSMKKTLPKQGVKIMKEERKKTIALERAAKEKAAKEHEERITQEKEQRLIVLREEQRLAKKLEDEKQAHDIQKENKEASSVDASSALASEVSSVPNDPIVAAPNKEWETERMKTRSEAPDLLSVIRENNLSNAPSFIEGVDKKRESKEIAEETSVYPKFQLKSAGAKNYQILMNGGLYSQNFTLAMFMSFVRSDKNPAALPIDVRGEERGGADRFLSYRDPAGCLHVATVSDHHPVPVFGRKVFSVLYKFMQSCGFGPENVTYG